jgi:hypothetical protein
VEQHANGWAFPETTPWPISGSGLQSGEEMRNVGNADFLCAYGGMIDPQRGGSPILQKPWAMPSLLTFKKSIFSKLNRFFKC